MCTAAAPRTAACWGWRQAAGPTARLAAPQKAMIPPEKPSRGTQATNPLQLLSPMPPASLPHQGSPSALPIAGAAEFCAQTSENRPARCGSAHSFTPRFPLLSAPFLPPHQHVAPPGLRSCRPPLFCGHDVTVGSPVTSRGTVVPPSTPAGRGGLATRAKSAQSRAPQPRPSQAAGQPRPIVRENQQPPIDKYTIHR